MKLVSVPLLFLLALPSTAAAQNHGIFVDGGALFGVRFTPSAEGDPTLFTLGGSLTYEWNDINGDRRWQPGEEGALLPSSQLEQRSKSRVAVGGVAAIGAFISDSVSVRFETAFIGDYKTTVSSNSQSFLESIDGTATTSFTDFTIAAAWHQSSRRLAISYLGGVVFRREESETSLITTYRTRSTISPVGGSLVPIGIADAAFEQTFTSTAYRTGIATGVDVAVNFSRHLAIVPQLRMVAFDQDWSLRPVVALRWRQ